MFKLIKLSALSASKLTTFNPQCVAYKTNQAYSASDKPSNPSDKSSNPSSSDKSSTTSWQDKTSKTSNPQSSDKHSPSSSSSDKTSTDKASTDKSSTSSTYKSTTDKSPADKISTDKTSTDKTSTDKISSDKSSLDKGTQAHKSDSTSTSSLNKGLNQTAFTSKSGLNQDNENDKAKSLFDQESQKDFTTSGLDSKKSNLGSVSSSGFGSDSAGKSTNDQEVHWGSEKKDQNPLRGDNILHIYDKSKTDQDSTFSSSSTTDAKEDKGVLKKLYEKVTGSSTETDQAHLDEYKTQINELFMKYKVQGTDAMIQDFINWKNKKSSL